MIGIGWGREVFEDDVKEKLVLLLRSCDYYVLEVLIFIRVC